VWVGRGVPASEKERKRRRLLGAGSSPRKRVKARRFTREGGWVVDRFVLLRGESFIVKWKKGTKSGKECRGGGVGVK